MYDFFVEFSHSIKVLGLFWNLTFDHTIIGLPVLPHCSVVARCARGSVTVTLFQAPRSCQFPPTTVDTQYPFYPYTLRVSTVLEMPYLDTRSESHLWLRDFQSQIQPNGTQRTTLIVAGVYVIIIAILWCVLYSSVYAKFG